MRRASTERGIKYITPRLHFKRGQQASAAGVRARSARSLGKIRRESRRRRSRSGWRRSTSSGKRVEERGAGGAGRACRRTRWRSSWSAGPIRSGTRRVNMDIGKKIQDLGILAIPQDFLPLEAADISDSWPNAYSRQIQKKLVAARLIRQDPRLRAVVLTYFACGPDSFANPFFKDEIGEPCYVMQIDEHTADAGRDHPHRGVRRHRDARASAKEFEIIRTDDTPITELDGPQALDSVRQRGRADAGGGDAGLWHRRRGAAALARRRAEPRRGRRSPRTSACRR